MRRKLYTVYRDKDDTLLVFEQPYERCAELMGISKGHLGKIIAHDKEYGYTVIKVETD